MSFACCGLWVTVLLHLFEHSLLSLALAILLLLIHSFGTVHCSCPPHLHRCPWKILSWASKVFLPCVVLENCNPGPHAVGQDSTS